MPERPDATVVLLRPKVRFTCRSCKHTWTSALGQFAVILEQKKLSRNRYYIKTKVIAYWFNCQKCGEKGDMKSYESEMERIAAITAKQALEKFGFEYEKEIGGAKVCKPRGDHIEKHCEACKLGICTTVKKTGRRRAPKKQPKID